jgi:hypothetical protein
MAADVTDYGEGNEGNFFAICSHFPEIPTTSGRRNSLAGTCLRGLDFPNQM